MAETSGTKLVTVTNAEGLHLRPASTLAALAKEFQSTVQVSFRGETVDAKSIMSLATLGAEQGAELTILANGDDAQAALDAVAELFAAGFREGDDKALDANQTPVSNDP